MAKKLVTDLEVAGKKVIVRVDFNVPHKGEEITDDNRIVAALPTIKYLLEHDAKVILLSHLGKVDYKKTPEEIEALKKKNDMVIVARKLQEYLPNNKVTFANATRGEELENAIANMNNGEVVLMQNTRYEKGESKNDEELGKYWASLGDLFV
ncbi:MAG: phosphoglycerate kinase, partial [Bacillota bacterium]|nr:phosphoglycerate kinase [Bacillota bacterium]